MSHQLSLLTSGDRVTTMARGMDDPDIRMLASTVNTQKQLLERNLQRQTDERIVNLLRRQLRETQILLETRLAQLEAQMAPAADWTQLGPKHAAGGADDSVENSEAAAERPWGFELDLRIEVTEGELKLYDKQQTTVYAKQSHFGAPEAREDTALNLNLRRKMLLSTEAELPDADEEEKAMGMPRMRESQGDDFDLRPPRARGSDALPQGGRDVDDLDQEEATMGMGRPRAGGQESFSAPGPTVGNRLPLPRLMLSTAYSNCQPTLRAGAEMGVAEPTLRARFDVDTPKEPLYLTTDVLRFLAEARRSYDARMEALVSSVDFDLDDLERNAQATEEDATTEFGDSAVFLADLRSSTGTPINSVIHIHVGQLQCIFSCEPLSRIECKLTLPELNLALSSDTEAAPTSDGGEFRSSFATATDRSSMSTDPRTPTSPIKHGPPSERFRLSAASVGTAPEHQTRRPRVLVLSALLSGTELSVYHPFRTDKGSRALFVTVGARIVFCCWPFFFFFSTANASQLPSFIPTPTPTHIPFQVGQAACHIVRHLATIDAVRERTLALHVSGDSIDGSYDTTQLKEILEFKRHWVTSLNAFASHRATDMPTAQQQQRQPRGALDRSPTGFRTESFETDDVRGSQGDAASSTSATDHENSMDEHPSRPSSRADSEYNGSDVKSPMTDRRSASPRKRRKSTNLTVLVFVKLSSATLRATLNRAVGTIESELQGLSVDGRITRSTGQRFSAAARPEQRTFRLAFKSAQCKSGKGDGILKGQFAVEEFTAQVNSRKPPSVMTTAFKMEGVQSSAAPLSPDHFVTPDGMVLPLVGEKRGQCQTRHTHLSGHVVCGRLSGHLRYLDPLILLLDGEQIEVDISDEWLNPSAPLPQHASVADVSGHLLMPAARSARHAAKGAESTPHSLGLHHPGDVEVHLEASTGHLRLAVTQNTLPNLQSIARRVRETIRSQRSRFLERGASGSDERDAATPGATPGAAPDADADDTRGVGPLRYGTIQIVGDDLMVVCFGSGLLSRDFALLRMQDYRADFLQAPHSSQNHLFTRQSLGFRIGDHMVEDVAELSVYHVQRAPAIRLHEVDDPQRFFELCVDRRNSQLGILRGPRCKIDMGAYLRAEMHMLESRFGLKTKGSVGVTVDAGQYMWLHKLVRAYIKHAAPSTLEEATMADLEASDQAAGHSPLLSQASPTVLVDPANTASDDAQDWAYVCLLREDVEDDPDGIYKTKARAGGGRGRTEHGGAEDADNDGCVMGVREGRGKRNRRTKEKIKGWLGFAPQGAALCGHRSIQYFPPAPWPPHSLHGEACAFVLNPNLHRLTIGNVKIPSIDWMMTNIFMVSNPHEAINKAVFWGLQVPLGRTLAKCNAAASKY